MHDLIMQSKVPSDPFVDQQIVTNFTKLEGDINDLVKEHFPAVRHRPNWQIYDKVEKLDEHDFFLRGWIASSFAYLLFAPRVGLFNLEKENEEHLGDFENLLYDRQGE
ncbi:hypothetical protein MMC25_001777 [Agyrium rufum]|nr:hypothetical protein [Agyrium rufum]